MTLPAQIHRDYKQAVASRAIEVFEAAEMNFGKEEVYRGVNGLNAVWGLSKWVW